MLWKIHKMDSPVHLNVTILLMLDNLGKNLTINLFCIYSKSKKLVYKVY